MGKQLVSTANYVFPEKKTEEADAYMKDKGRFLVICHGIVTETEHHEVFFSKFHKTVNSFFRGEPYQLGHQTVEYTIRVEEMSSSYTRQVNDFYLYGNYMGRLYPGDEVELVASKGRNRYVVKSIYNVTTDSRIKPGIQLSAVLVRCWVIVTTCALIYLGIFISRFFANVNGASLALPIIGVALTPRMIKKWIGKKLRKR